MSKKLKLFSKYISTIVILLSFSFYAHAQDVPTDDEVVDSVKTGVEMGNMRLKDPKSIQSKYEYDPVSNKYIYKKTANDFDVNAPLILTPSEYEALVRKENIKNYFREKIKSIDSKKENEADKRNLLPTYYVKSGLFENIFGSNTIDIKPIGTVELDLGMRYTKQDNPILSPRNRRTYSFDFNQRISLSLMGKVGTRLSVNTNYDTKSTFAFQNLLKLEYAPTEDDIIQKIEVGNVSLPLSSALIKGAQSLFGVKAQFKFGRTTITGIFSEQKSQTKTVVAEGGGTLEEFNLFALDYDADRHFFLSQYFRNRYDYSLRNYPFIDSRVKVTRVEVWVTNRQNRVNSTQNNMRNIIALQDLGEAQLTTKPADNSIPDNQIVALNPIPADFFNVPADSPSDNKNNKFNPDDIDGGNSYLNSKIRDVGLAGSGFNGVTVTEGIDFSKLENARKLTSPSEYTYHQELGYISLAQKLTNDEVLAVAYEYTIGDQVYRVGEFANGGVDATVVTGNDAANQSVSSQALVLKMLKSNLTNVEKPVWNLMMKNIYQIPGAYQLSPNDFKLNVVYSDPSPVNYITANQGMELPTGVKDTPLIKVLNLDRLNYNNDPEAGGDGFFDFIPGLTVDQQNGRIIFTTTEPFGKHMFNKLSTGSTSEDYTDEFSYNLNQQKYVFRSMYRTTQAASLQQNQKNKYQLKGKFKSTGGDGIPIGAFNVPKGSVRVTAGGRMLTEGVDYTVNYQAGRVQILDPALKTSNVPIQVSVENNSVFGQQTRRFSGVTVEHKISDKFIIGGTLINLHERPLTQKSNYGSESVNNTIYGLNTNFSTELPLLTRLINKFPTIDTEVPSNLSFRGEVAFLKPGAPKAANFDGEAAVYVDDFEGSQSTVDLRSPIAWQISSAPVGLGGERTEGDLSYGYNRAKLNWYTIDPVFYTNQRPGEINESSVSFNKTRRIYNQEVFPVTDIAIGQNTVIPTLDLSYYPKERGPYNFNPTANGNTLNNPAQNWGGIMRAINTTDFEQSNVQYIHFWIQDPYLEGETLSNNTGKIIFNLGEISEDILKDGRKQYENGLPTDGGNQNTVVTNWGKIPSTQSLVYAFDTSTSNRTNQDVGFDGLDNNQESAKYAQFAALEDPAADDYSYYLNSTGDVLQRYKKYNGLDGNSPITVTDTNRGSSTLPDAEDVNRDNTMNTINAYYEYSIDMKPGIKIGDKYVTDIRNTSVKTPDGNTKTARWIQYKIPIFAPERTEGTINGFRSIRFMRMLLNGFDSDITVRFATLEFIRGDWRRYVSSLDEKDPNKNNTNTQFDVLAVNIQENGNRTPIPYVLPPNVRREQLTVNNTLINQNEQSLSIRVCDLNPNDGRGVFKATSVDMRQFKKLKMFLHAESKVGATPLQDNQLIGFLRFGNDVTDNFYEVEIPLKVTAPNATSSDEIWPEKNDIDLKLEDLIKLKLKALAATNVDKTKIYYLYEDEIDPSAASKENKLHLGIKGNPDFGLIRSMMVGVKNNGITDACGEVWFNELRISDMENKGGMAALASLDTNIADVAAFSATGRMSTIGFGSVEQKPNDRSRVDSKQYDIVTNVNLGKFLPKKAGLTIPMNIANGEQFITPQYDPFYRDVKLELVKEADIKGLDKDFIMGRAIDYTKRNSLSFIGVRKERAPEQKKRIYDVENFTVNYSYNETNQHNYEIESLRDQKVRTGVDYTYSFDAKHIEPLKKVKILGKSEYLKILQEINFKPVPDNISFSGNITRQMNRQQFRQIDVAGIPLDPLFRRNFLFDYNYVVNYNIFKSLKLTYNATNSNIVRNYLDKDNMAIPSFTLWDDFWATGTPNNHKQTLTANYELPISKIPVFKFVKSQYNYTSNFDWRRSNTAMSTYVADDGTTFKLGNTIQNSNTQALNTTLDMAQFYKYIGLGPKPKNRKRDERSFTAPPSQPAAPNAQNQSDEKESAGKIMGDFGMGLLTSVKTIQINYSENNGTVLPGFLPYVGFFGTTAPTLPFVFGSQSDIRYQMAVNGYLTNYPNFNQNYTQVQGRTLNMTAGIDLMPDFRVDLIADRLRTENYVEQYDAANGYYNSRSPYTTGNYSISTILIKTSFANNADTFSETFETFKSNRLIIANRLAEQYYGTKDFPVYNNPLDPVHVKNMGYPVGFGKSSQAVLIPSFLSAYSGSDASDYSTSTFKRFPLPNWTIKYSGLMRLSWFKDNFKRFSLHHGYKATYSINAYRSNFEYDKNPGGQSTTSGDFIPKMLIGNMNLVEQFNPLIRVDFELKSSYKFLAEMKKDRALSLSFDNNLLTDVSGYEYILGMGYRIKNVSFNSRFADNAAGVIKNDINVRADFSYRNNKTVIRYLDVLNNDRLSGGQNIWTIKFTADYAFSKSLTAIMFYDHSFSKAVISTAFPLTNIRAGFTIRYNFGN